MKINLNSIYLKVSIIVMISIIYYKYHDTSLTEEQVFTEIYDKNLWGGGSGPGSNVINAEPYLKLLQTYLDDSRFESIVDLGCGDWQLMRTLKIPDSKTYIGFDLVKSVINTNTQNYQKDNIHFNHIHELADLRNQKGDLLIVKDVLQHWPNQQIKYFIKEILPNFKYALITNDYSATNNNAEIENGNFRAIDLEAEPFNMSSIKTLLNYPAHGILKRVYLYIR